MVTSSFAPPPGLKIIYQPKGKALEYGELAANLYRGCSHGCTYCYVPGVLKRSREEFHSQVGPRHTNILDDFRRDCERLAGMEDVPAIFLSFTTDPYQPAETRFHLTRGAIKIAHAHALRVNVLTKDPARALRDCGLFGSGDSIGTTIAGAPAFMDANQMEPGAPPEKARLEALMRFHELGIRTWVSMEPVLSPGSILDVIDGSHEYVDLYKIGRWNYSAEAKEINWAWFAQTVVAKLESLGKAYYIKEDLRRCLG